MRAPDERQLFRLGHLGAAVHELGGEAAAGVAATVHAEAEEIVDALYERLLDDEEGRELLTTEVIQGRLRGSLADWLRSLFPTQVEPKSTVLLNRHHEIGTIHARIGVPMTLVNWGIRLIKRELSERVVSRLASPRAQLKVLRYVDEVLDIAADALSEAYLANVVTNARHHQALSLFLAGNSLAVECERARSGLFNWHRAVVLSLFSEDLTTIQPIRESELGLWLLHKAELTVADPQEAAGLRRAMDDIDRSIARYLADSDRHEPEVRRRFVSELEPRVERLAQSLAQLGERAVSVELGRDPLTRLLNRRYLPAIMQLQVTLSRREGSGFGLLMVDADEFKRVNDVHGHQVGDHVLARLAETLLGTVRSSDFAFRYGGEEFLLVLPGVSWTTLEHRADRILDAVRALSICDLTSQALRLTVSIGGAMYEGHPDYERVVHLADRALGLAKQGGRDRAVLLRATT